MRTFLNNSLNNGKKLHFSIYVIFLFALPFLFLSLRIFDSHVIRIGFPILVVLLLFSFVVYITVRDRNYTLLMGVILITPLFLSATISIADFPLLSNRSATSRFTSNLQPSLEFILGTDYEGRDIFASIIVGGMNVYLVASIATFTALLFGIPLGVMLTFPGHILKNIAFFIIQFFEIIPQLFFILIVLGVFNFWAATSAESRLVVYYTIPLAGFVVGISSLPSISRIVENRILQLNTHRFVLALRSSNVSEKKILFYNILWKNCIPEVLVQASFLFGSVLLIESALGYAFEIGFGDLGTGGYLSWGKILAEARRSILFGYNFRIVFFPIAVTLMSILGVNMLGDSLVKYIKKEN